MRSATESIARLLSWISSKSRLALSQPTTNNPQRYQTRHAYRNCKAVGVCDEGTERAGAPAVKVRGREYLRIIYGPEYTLPENLERLKSRGLGTKRSLALREFALGLEALERFVHKEPLRRVHECVFVVLALESEPVDPRL